jgi:hypothetical protein
MFFATGESDAEPAALLHDLRRKILDLKIGYVVLHTERLTPAWRARSTEMLDSMPELERFASGRAETLAYRVRPIEGAD